jgi:hypothetical protein
MSDVRKMYVMEMLDEVVTPVEGSMHLGLVLALLIFMTSHMKLVRAGFATERTTLKWILLGAAADPRSPKRMYGILVSNPLVFCLESSWTECAEEWKVTGWYTCIVETVNFRFFVR